MQVDAGEVKSLATPVPPSVRNAVIALACSILAAYQILTSIFSVLIWLPKMLDVYDSIKVRIPVLAEGMYRYGLYLWLALSVCVVVSFVRGLRHPGKASTVHLAIGTLVASLLLSWVSHMAVWGPFLGLFQGIGAQK